VRTGGILTGVGGIEGIVITGDSGSISDETVASTVTVRSPKRIPEKRIAFFGADNKENAHISLAGFV